MSNRDSMPGVLAERVRERHLTERAGSAPNCSCIMSRTEFDGDSCAPIAPIADGGTQPVPLQPRDITYLGVVELILKQPRRLDAALSDPRVQSLLVSRFLGIACFSFVLFGVALAFAFDSARVWPQLIALDRVFDAGASGESVALLQFHADSRGLWRWIDGSAWHLLAAYTLGLIATTCVCLPSLYFYGLLAGVKMSLVDVVLHALKAKATGAVALIGLLPLYAALAMGVIIAVDTASLRGPAQFLVAALWLGLSLPSLAGLFGTHAMYRGFQDLPFRLSDARSERRRCFLNRLTLSWAGVYTAIAPIMVFTLWESFSR